MARSVKAELKTAEWQLVESMRQSHTWQSPFGQGWCGKVAIGGVIEAESHMAESIKAKLRRKRDNW